MSHDMFSVFTVQLYEIQENKTLSYQSRLLDPYQKLRIRDICSSWAVHELRTWGIRMVRYRL